MRITRALDYEFVIISTKCGRFIFLEDISFVQNFKIVVHKWECECTLSLQRYLIFNDKWTRLI